MYFMADLSVAVSRCTHVGQVLVCCPLPIERLAPKNIVAPGGDACTSSVRFNIILGTTTLSLISGHDHQTHIQVEFIS